MTGRRVQCPECGWSREGGCRWDCPLHHAPTDQSQYRLWADNQREQYQQFARSAVHNLVEQRRREIWEQRHPDVPYDERYAFYQRPAD